MQKDPTRYGCLTTEPFATQIASNYQAYSNDFLQFLLKNMNEYEDYHGDVMQDDPTYGQTYRQFVYQYQQFCQYLYQMQLQMQNYQTMQQGLG
jgi:hypothetical protein